MAGEDPYHAEYIGQMDPFRDDPIWMTMDPTSFSGIHNNNVMRTVDGPYLRIVEQPKQRGFRFRYGCEGPSHGGLPGASSEKNRKSYPQVKICNYQGAARVVVQLVTNSASPHLHAHSLVGKQCDKGICIADLQPKDSSISFPNLGILHVTKKNVSKVLEERMIEAYRMGYNYGISIHPEIDALQGEVRVPRELADAERNLISSSSVHQSKEMDLSVVRLMFTAFLPDSDGGFSRRLEPVISDPIFDSKAPNASNLKIVRMDRTAGCVTGGEEVYLLCDKVQKDDIQVRFYEDDESGLTWEAFGDFSPTDVHRQFAIVFKTPKYRDLNLQKPISVFVQLKRKSDNETSEPKPFTYHPQIIDKEEVQRKRQKTLPNFQDYSGAGGGAGGMFRGGGGGSTAGGGPSGGGGGHFFQGYQAYNNYGSGYNFSPGMGGGGTTIKYTYQEPVEDSDEDSDSDSDDDDPGAGGAVRICAQSEPVGLGVASEDTDPTEDLESNTTGCVLESHLAELAGRQAQALFRYTLSGDARMLLAPQRPLMTAQDENGDTGLHLGVIHSQTDAVRNLAQVILALPGEDVLNMRNDLYQTPLHLAVLTQQKEAVEALLEAEVDVTLTDRHGNTPLHLAAQQKDDSVLRSLLKHKSVAQLTSIPNTAGLCPLHLAVQANILSCVRALLDGGADVEVQELTCGRTALHLATEMGNLSLAGCLLLEGNAYVDSVTYNGSTPLHIAAGRDSAKLCALLMAAGADPHKENFEPLFFKDDELCGVCEEEEEEDEGYVPGTTPMNMAASPEVYDILNGEEYKPATIVVPQQGDMNSLSSDTKQELCQALEEQTGGWESLAHALGLGILTSAFRLSPCPAGKLLDSYEVSGGTVRELLEGLKHVGNSSAVGLLQAVCKEPEAVHSTTQFTGPGLCKSIQGLKLGHHQEESGICDSGVETSF
ncbi:nuclear factor NF-kappa-B p105 subunit [Puntigrus tetrazona]|uniref:nuclear factor NF-kappa-B p105 subunit n=1 Tax=Puntigrus tetrazona TaxID=1606681 RepID=UPI001C891318|nr:nuclear factor NF-kappa-B p105 subunit [Puntigrus tetrazona]XP_043112591.1 nuclear factor NF-kappa-B p105 subunit [Puntigrus tetrazona]XP_043112592.1 nuclear factor NF-kappa-B p105 subunit [Puntigrus tetrazona]